MRICRCYLQSESKLQRACLVIAFTELLISSAIAAIRLGSLTSQLVHYNDLTEPRDDEYWRTFAYSLQAFCFVASMFHSGYLFVAFIKRSMLSCFAWIIGIVLIQIVSIVSAAVSVGTVHSDCIFFLVAVVRICFIWIVAAYAIEIRKSSPNLTKSEAPTVKSSIRYFGDG